MNRIGLLLSIIWLSFAWAQAPLQITFTHHSSASNTFWQAVKKGMDEACTLIQADCQMVFVQTEGDITQQVSNMEAAVAAGTDVLITSIVDNNALDGVIQSARDKGIIVLGSNVDDLEGENGNARLAFIGQDFLAAGYALGKKMSEQFPTEGPVHVLVGISAPGQNWSETRGAGVLKFMEEYKAKHSEREVTFEKIDSGTDLAITSSRVMAYLQANPNTTAYFDTGFWHAGVAQALKDAGTPPGKILLGGFDLVPEALNMMKEGYIQVQVDQQPYLQGFLPVLQAYLMNKYKLGKWDVNTGSALILPEQVDAILELSQQGYR